MRKTVLGWAYTDKPKTTTASILFRVVLKKNSVGTKKLPGRPMIKRSKKERGNIGVGT